MTYDPTYLRDLGRTLERPYIPDELSITPGNRRFLFSVVTSAQSDDLIAQLKARMAEEKWGLQNWVDEAVLYPGFVVSISRAGDADPSGFLAFDTRVYIHPWGGTGEVRVSVTLEPKTVYVSPDVRGQGFGDAFAALLAGELRHTLSSVSEACRTSLSKVRVGNVDVSMEAECVSEQGARFVRNALAACQKVVSEFSIASNLPDCELENHIDFGDWEEDITGAFGP